jgi:transcriptional antiterminator
MKKRPQEFEINGKIISIITLANDLNCSRETIYYHLKSGKTINDVVKMLKGKSK